VRIKKKKDVPPREGKKGGGIVRGIEKQTQDINPQTAPHQKEEKDSVIFPKRKRGTKKKPLAKKKKGEESSRGKRR